MTIQLTRLGTVVSCSQEDLRRAREELQRQSCVRIKQLLGPALLQLVQRRIEDGEFVERVHKGETAPIRIELYLMNNTVSGLLNFLANDERLFELMEQMTGCGRIGYFLGRVYRLTAELGYNDLWHHDLVEPRRMIGMSINLSSEDYSGGAFQIRDRRSGQIYEVNNTGFGDAIIFRLAEHLEHRNTPMEGTVPKTAFVGWFRSQAQEHENVSERGLFAPTTGILDGHMPGIEKPPESPIRTWEVIQKTSLDSRIEIPEEVMFQRAGHKTVLLNLESGFYYWLDPVASRFWELLTEHQVFNEAFDAMALEYDVPAEDLKVDLIHLVQGFAAKGLIEVAS